MWPSTVPPFDPLPAPGIANVILSVNFRNVSLKDVVLNITTTQSSRLAPTRIIPEEHQIPSLCSRPPRLSYECSCPLYGLFLNGDPSRSHTYCPDVSPSSPHLDTCPAPLCPCHFVPVVAEAGPFVLRFPTLCAVLAPSSRWDLACSSPHPTPPFLNSAVRSRGAVRFGQRGHGRGDGEVSCRSPFLTGS